MCPINKLWIKRKYDPHHFWSLYSIYRFGIWCYNGQWDWCLEESKQPFHKQRQSVYCLLVSKEMWWMDQRLEISWTININKYYLLMVINMTSNKLAHLHFCILMNIENWRNQDLGIKVLRHFRVIDILPWTLVIKINPTKIVKII